VSKTIAEVGTVDVKLTDDCDKRLFSSLFEPRFLETAMLEIVSATSADGAGQTL
jgi:hypothetical protein